MLDAPIEAHGLNGGSASVSQPDPPNHNWQVAIHCTDRGCSLSLESGKVDALMRLRQLAEQMIVALGGQVEWKV